MQQPIQPRAVHIGEELEKLVFLEGRTKQTPLAAEDVAFATLAPYRDGGVFAGGFSGESPWERHASGDEFVHVLAGAATLTILGDAHEETFELREGVVIVVPRGRWHRFEAPHGVTVMTITPEPTEHSAADDPRSGE